MKKIGLALSGGGFRASLYHLGLIRFLRDAAILPQVTHITSVSGGSIFAAHLALNWERYNGTPQEFDAAAAEILAFVQLDVRNRILRRFPMTLPLRWPRKLIGLSNRKLSRTGLLEYQYEKRLFGDTSLFELPESPQLHILATNLNQGCLCSFSRQGLLMPRALPGHAFHIDCIHVGLATVAMAVTASSAYPGFFPPLELTGAEVGATAGGFGRQSYTDGGIFDNLGVRMFRCLERQQLADTPLCQDDFFDVHDTVAEMRKAAQSGDGTPLWRLWQVLTGPRAQSDQSAVKVYEKADSAPPADAEEAPNDEMILSKLWDVMRKYPFYHDPVFGDLAPRDSAAAAFLQSNRAAGRMLEISDRLWLNRHLLEAAFRQATGRPCFRRLNSVLDGLLVSDVGKPIQVESKRRAGGMIRTALRASDILMDRVWQLEKETFHDTRGLVFAPITEVVEPSEDPTALHPEIQVQAANIRTDLDRFTPLEITSLVKHGYGVARKACRARPDLFGKDLPANPPWDPLPGSQGAASSTPNGKSTGRASKSLAPATIDARALQASANRKIWSSLFDYRDWASYLHLPILLPILILVPYFLVKYYQQSQRINQIVKSLSHGSRDLEEMTHLLEGRSVPWNGVPFEEVDKVAETPASGFEILQDSRIMDLRNWKSGDVGSGNPSSLSFGYRRLRVTKQVDSPETSFFYLNLIPVDVSAGMRFPPQELTPILRRGNLEDAGAGVRTCRWQVAYDFRQVPTGEIVDLLVEYYSPGSYLQRNENGTDLPLQIRTSTAELTLWILMPLDREYKSWGIVRYPKAKPQNVERVKPVTEYLADNYSILAFKLLSVKPDHIYEVQWLYK
jgi:predicted acylesterase/phospholipase RssA